MVMVVLPIWSYLLLLQVHEKYAGHEEEWRYELRVRYIPTDLKDLYEKDKVTFYYYYDQVSPPWSFWITVKITDISTLLCVNLIDWNSFENRVVRWEIFENKWQVMRWEWGLRTARQCVVLITIVTAVTSFISIIVWHLKTLAAFTLSPLSASVI